MKNLLISGVVGLLFISGGFFLGFRLVPKPAPKPVAASHAVAAAVPVPPKPAFSIDTLKAATDGLCDLNQAIQAREQAVTAREQKAAQLEQELTAERAALDETHRQFQLLFGEFQKRLQLITANQYAQLQKQATIYSAMEPETSVDMIRAMGDGAVMRLFAVLEEKDLTKIIAAWKEKYPADTQRVLFLLDRMGQVVPADQIALPTPAPAAPSDSTSAPAPATADATPPVAAPTPDASNTPPTPSTPATPDSAPAPAAADSSAAPASTPPADPSTAPAPAAADSSTATASTPPSDPSTAPAPAPASAASPATTPPPVGGTSSASTMGDPDDSLSIPGATAAIRHTQDLAAAGSNDRGD